MAEQVALQIPEMSQVNLIQVGAVALAEDDNEGVEAELVGVVEAEGVPVQVIQQLTQMNQVNLIQV